MSIEVRANRSFLVNYAIRLGIIIGVGWVFAATLFVSVDQTREAAVREVERQLRVETVELENKLLEATRLLQIEVKELEDESFEDYMEYWGIYPSQSVVPYGAESFWVSDSQVHRGGFRITWMEFVECDYDPYDNVEIYSYYVQAVSSSTRYDGPRSRRDVAGRVGFPANNIATGEPIKYPKRDADCRLVSDMTQYHKHDVTKELRKYSRIVKVRDLGKSNG